MKVNIQNNIWLGVPIAKRIVFLISYAGIFRDVLSEQTLIEKLGIKDHAEFEEALESLKEDGLIIRESGFVGLPGLSDKIKIKSRDFERAKELISSNSKMLKTISKLPIVKFIGISGSIAAGNPVDTKEKKADLDLFIITRNQCIWFFYLFDSFYRFFNRKKKKEGGVYLCMNHIYDESDLRIYNQNFYTANELYNLKLYYGEDTYKKFIASNPWVSGFFPGFGELKGNIKMNKSSNYINRMMYSFIKVFRSVKLRSLEPFKEMMNKFDPTKSYNVNRKGSSYGGYQIYIQEKYPRIIKENFPGYMDEELISRLFADPLSLSLKSSKFDVNKIKLSETYESKYRTYE